MRRMAWAHLARVGILLVTLFSFGQAITQSNQAAMERTTRLRQSQKLGAGAIWLPSEAFLNTTQTACKAGTDMALCMLNRMATAGAPPQAVQFSRQLYQHSKQFGVMYRFQSVGPVDMAQVFYPLRDADFPYAVASMRYGLLLVNGDPPILDIDDLTRLDMRGLEHDKGYQGLKKNFPGLQVWGGGRGGTSWPQVQKSDGGLSFDIYYVLNPVRPAGSWRSGAHFDWNFDAAGKFLGTKFTGGIGLLPS